jgi:hypothetical protein
MPANTPDQQITYPVGTDLADNPAAFLAMLADVEQRLVRLYTDAADRTARQLLLVENEISALSSENRVDIYNGTNNISLGARTYSSMLRRTADAAAINNSTTLVSDAVLTAPVDSGATYSWEAGVFFDADAAADIKFAFTTPTFSTMRWAGTGLSAAATGSTASVKIASTTVSGTSIDFGAFGAGTANTTFFSADGYIVTTAAGNIVLQYAQQTLSATNLVVRAGSYLRVLRES